MSYTSPNQSRSPLYNLLLATGLLIVLGSLLAVHEMESQGHIITGMNNQIVWGLPHVFAIFLIVAASGVLNVSSIGSVFNKP
ncbi:MAG: molybdopterin oxidoreductase, partial [Gallionellaceae bacterium CG02_land_8_20_14_3_00_60_115]